YSSKEVVMTGHTTFIEQPRQRRDLEQCLDILANGFADATADFLGDDVRVSVGTIRQSIYGEVLLSELNAASFYSLRTTPDFGRLLLQWSPRVLGMVLDRMLGASRLDGTVAQLPLSEIQSRLITKLVDRFITALQNACDSKIEVVVDNTATKLHELQLLPVDAVTKVIAFEIELDGSMAELQMLVPSDWHDRMTSTRPSLCEDGLVDTTVEIVARLAKTQLSSTDIANLTVGDIITTDKDVADPLDVTVDGAVKFVANLGKAGEKKAIRILTEIPAAIASEDGQTLNGES
ncbi:MAG: FliM/FliN family flagellar motor switch protein, partial [Planctomycetales bacterium]